MNGSILPTNIEVHGQKKGTPLSHRKELEKLSKLLGGLE